jgi:hypothetical protein
LPQDSRLPRDIARHLSQDASPLVRRSDESYSQRRTEAWFEPNSSAGGRATRLPPNRAGYMAMGLSADPKMIAGSPPHITKP